MLLIVYHEEVVELIAEEGSVVIPYIDTIKTEYDKRIQILHDILWFAYEDICLDNNRHAKWYIEKWTNMGGLVQIVNVTTLNRTFKLMYGYAGPYAAP